MQTKTIRKRLDPDCDDFESASRYFHERAIQLVPDGYVLNRLEPHEGALVAVWDKFGRRSVEAYVSIYIYKSSRGKGKYLEMLCEYPHWKILTSKDCDLYDYFMRLNRRIKDKELSLPGIHASGIEYEYGLGFHDTVEYQTISKFYGDGRAKRSGVHFMNHIDEGLAVLHWIGASTAAMKAYCLHPVFQSDEEIARFGTSDFRELNMFGVNANVITNAVEYRHVANAYLSTREIGGIDEIKLSPLKDVNDMLIADKVQNRKDFELYHEGTHIRSAELAKYFRNWLERLGVSEEVYEAYHWALRSGNRPQIFKK